MNDDDLIQTTIDGIFATWEAFLAHSMDVKFNPTLRDFGMITSKKKEEFEIEIV